MILYLLAALVNPFPNNKIFDNNVNVNEKLQFILGRVENIVRKGENAGNQHFLLFPQCFQKANFSGLLKVRVVW